MCPTIHIEQDDFVVLTQLMASITVKILAEPVTDLRAFRDEIIAAIDFLITGI
ncbi:CcdB family protein [Alishewanella sp. HL-SH06]|uniref:CcdB family protein n=1 Tax=Alishewanella sp. HL-SH06 TaxID=3461144 RepID=UPI0040430A1A